MPQKMTTEDAAQLARSFSVYYRVSGFDKAEIVRLVEAAFAKASEPTPPVKTATLVRDVSENNWNGTAALYHLSEPATIDRWGHETDPTEWVIVSAIAPGSTAVFAAERDGSLAVYVWVFVRIDFCDHEAALAEMGYVVP